MSNTGKIEHQHFIPRSYIKNFAHQKKDKRFVDAVDIESKKKLYLSTKHICVKSNLYTLPKTGKHDPYAIERYYAESVDNVYPEVYKLLVDKNVVSISGNQKRKILHTLLSLYFRTPKFLNASNKMTDDAIAYALEMSDKEKEEINLNFDGRQLKFLRGQADEVKKALREENRQTFLQVHLETWHEFVANKYQCDISVYEVEGEIDLITSDNPVDIRSSVQNKFNLFDPTNVIQVPLDRRHFLFVFPNTEESEKNRINRGVRDKYFALSSNHSVQENAENWIFGYPGTVEKHLSDQEKYGKFDEEGLRYLNHIEQKTTLMKELLQTAETYGFFSHPVANRVKQYRKMECFQGDTELGKYVLELAKQGFLTV